MNQEIIDKIESIEDKTERSKYRVWCWMFENPASRQKWTEFFQQHDATFAEASDFAKQMTDDPQAIAEFVAIAI